MTTTNAELEELRESKRLLEIRDGIDICRERGLDIPGGFEDRAKRSGWNKNDVVRELFQSQSTPGRGADMDVLDRMQRSERREFSLCRAIEGSASGTLSGFEREVSEETSRRYDLRSSRGLVVPYEALQRSMLAGAHDTGGATIPVDIGQLIAKRDPRPVVEVAGASIFRGLSAPTAFPRHTEEVTATWVAEAEQVPESTPKFDDVMLTPHALSAYTEVSRQLTKTSSIDAESFVRNELMRRFNLGLDAAALFGPGTSGIPKGVFSLGAQSGIHEVDFSGAPSWSKILEFEGQIEDADGLADGLAFITSAAVKQAWKGTAKDGGSGLFLVDSDNRADGHPVLVTSQLKGTTYEDRVAFGAWANCMIGLFGAVEILVDQSSALHRRGMIGLTVLGHADVAFRHPQSFAISSDKGNQ